MVVDSDSCPSGEVKCEGACVDLQTDADNCGQCGTPCALECSAGVCQTGGTTEPGPCNAPDTLCGSTCVNVQTDPQNCGGCGIDCGPSAVCSLGVCDLPPKPCVTCGEALTVAIGAANVCDGTSAILYKDLVSCTCSGACAGLCSANICNGGDAPQECLDCVVDTSAGCGVPFNECSNDF